jgi:hypothetical protein
MGQVQRAEQQDQATGNFQEPNRMEDLWVDRFFAQRDELKGLANILVRVGQSAATS